VILAVVILSGRFITGSIVWGYDGKWVHLKTYWPFEVIYSPSILAYTDIDYLGKR
jgi:hypothetical protein